MKTFYSILFFTVFLSHNLFGQIEKIKQITDLDFDVRNPNYSNSIYSYPESPFITFEVHSDSSSEIAISSYYNWNDTFKSPIFVTNNGVHNTNPVGMAFDELHNPNNQIIVWETDINGNVDLVYKQYTVNNFNDYTFGEEQFITQTSADENDFSFGLSSNNVSILDF